MFRVNDDQSIYVTRGDRVFFAVSATENGEQYIFQPGDIVRVRVTAKKDCENVLMQKLFTVEEETESVTILLTGDDTKFGDVISKPTDYWYEVELNPFTDPQTIIGYDEDGAKILKLFPEGKDDTTTKPKDVPVVDSELSLTSERPIQNQAVTRALMTTFKGKISAVEMAKDGTVTVKYEDGTEESYDAIAKILPTLKGEKGDVGPEGPQGLQGIQGLQGPTGATGATGPQGIQGLTGATGATGAQGVQGPKGEKGDKGERGDSGIVAPTSGFYALTGDEDGNLYAVYAEGDEAPSFETDTDGNIYAIIPD